MLLEEQNREYEEALAADQEKAKLRQAEKERAEAEAREREERERAERCVRWGRRARRGLAAVAGRRKGGLGGIPHPKLSWVGMPTP
jgi:hypothetical protein